MAGGIERRVQLTPADWEVIIHFFASPEFKEALASYFGGTAKAGIAEAGGGGVGYPLSESRGSPVSIGARKVIPDDWYSYHDHLQPYRNTPGFEGQVHIGYDLNRDDERDMGVLVYAPAFGVVRYARTAPGSWGRLLCIQCRDVVVRYAHLSAFLVKEGERVNRGQPVGMIGDADGRFDAHLHADAVRLDFIESRGDQWWCWHGKDADTVRKHYVDLKAWIEEQAWWLV